MQSSTIDKDSFTGHIQFGIVLSYAVNLSEISTSITLYMFINRLALTVKAPTIFANSIV